ncbi:hypothetical protein L6164_008046 [Bauhinia variegata]|uniref:Uncharacterized protein n=1 Tax=Bauhinia variegata TaxID=167791 RepID=A0ACB9PGX6_BAUVA|nr:hypothetical protein L6164_008046 [Bauhinia variegata]
MRGALLRNFSFCARNLLLSRYNQNPNPIPLIVSLSASNGSTPRFYSSINNLRDEPRFTKTQKKESPVDAEDVTDEEMKKRLSKLREGDADAIPLVFEAILKRKLSGKHEEEEDHELIEEIFGEGTESESADESDEED